MAVTNFRSILCGLMWSVVRSVRKVESGTCEEQTASLLDLNTSVTYAHRGRQIAAAGGSRQAGRGSQPRSTTRPIGPTGGGRMNGSGGGGGFVRGPDPQVGRRRRRRRRVREWSGGVVRPVDRRRRRCGRLCARRTDCTGGSGGGERKRRDRILTDSGAKSSSGRKSSAAFYAVAAGSSGSEITEPPQPQPNEPAMAIPPSLPLPFPSLGRKTDRHHARRPVRPQPVQ